MAVYRTPSGGARGTEVLRKKATSSLRTVLGLNLDKNPPPVEDRCQPPPEGEERQRPGERGDVVRQPGGEEVTVEPLLQAHRLASLRPMDQIEDLRHQGAAEEGRDGVGAEDQEGARPGVAPSDVDQLIGGGEQQQRQAGGE